MLESLPSTSVTSLSLSAVTNPSVPRDGRGEEDVCARACVCARVLCVRREAVCIGSFYVFFVDSMVSVYWCTFVCLLVCVSPYRCTVSVSTYLFSDPMFRCTVFRWTYIYGDVCVCLFLYV